METNSGHLGGGIIGKSNFNASIHSNLNNKHVRISQLQDSIQGANRVVVVNDNQVIKPKVASDRKGLLPNTFLEAAVASKAPDLIVDDIEVGLVVCGSQVFRCNSETDSVGNALAKEASGKLRT